MSIERVGPAFQEMVRLEFEIIAIASAPREEYSFRPNYRVNAYAARGDSGAPVYVFNDGCGFAIGDIFMTLMTEADFFNGVKLDPKSVVDFPEKPGRFTDYSWLRGMDSEAFLPPMRMTTDPTAGHWAITWSNAQRGSLCCTRSCTTRRVICTCCIARV